MNLLYWADVAKVVSEKMPDGKIFQHEIRKELKSDHPKVKQVWFTGSTSVFDKTLFRTSLHILTVDGQRKTIEDIEDWKAQSLDIPEAIEFIESL